MPTLILSPRYSKDSRRLRAAAVDAGWSVLRPGGWEIPESVQEREQIFYGEIEFANVVARTSGIALLQPEPAWLTHLCRLRY